MTVMNGHDLALLKRDLFELKKLSKKKSAVKNPDAPPKKPIASSEQRRQAMYGAIAKFPHRSNCDFSPQYVPGVPQLTDDECRKAMWPISKSEEQEVSVRVYQIAQLIRDRFPRPLVGFKNAEEVVLLPHKVLVDRERGGYGQD